MKTSNEKYYQLVLLWITEPEKFKEYIEKAAAIISKYGDHADRILQPTKIRAGDIDMPHVVNLVHYPNKASFDYKNDPDFQKIVHLRDESTNIFSFQGYLNTTNPVSGNLDSRSYNVEILTYKDGSNKYYREYEKEFESIMKQFGYHVEYIMKVESGRIGNFRPNLVKVSYFESKNNKDLFEKDPMYNQIKENLYPSAVDKMIWIEANTTSLL